MTNLEKMKLDITTQINNMSATQFQHFLELISGEYSIENTKLINQDNLFKCNNCKEKYGDCDDNDLDICNKRFVQYSEETL